MNRIISKLAARWQWIIAVILLLFVIAFAFRSHGEQPIRVGVLHSLTGTMADSEKPLVDAVQLAIEEINAAGGIDQKKLESVVVDCRSEDSYCAEQAERLITQENVQVLFGCWTSSCRKALKPVVEKYNHLLIYPVQYEGMEQSPNILYTGAAPNQQIMPGTRWAMSKFGKRIFLLGSDYIFPKTANLIISDLVKGKGGAIVGERYIPLESKAANDIVDDIRRTKPDVVLNTLNGDSNAAFFKALKQAGLGNQPLVSFSVAENEMLSWGGAQLTQHYAVWSCFQSLPGEDNRRFVAAYQARFGAKRLTSDPIATAYTGVYLWVQAVSGAGSSTPVHVNPSLMRQSINSPCGIAAIDSDTRHLWKKARIGKVQPDGQFDQVYVSPAPLRPVPWPGYRSQEAWLALMKQEKL